MKCSCPWCNKEAEPNCESLAEGSPTCKEHSWEVVLQALKQSYQRKETESWNTK